MDTLTAERNKRRLKYVMVNKKIWLSLTSSYKIELAMNVAEFKRSREYNGVLVWKFIHKRVNPTTAISASNYKGDIERVDTFDNNIENLNTCFEDMITKIIKEEARVVTNFSALQGIFHLLKRTLL